MNYRQARKNMTKAISAWVNQIGAVLFLLALSVATNAATRVYDVTADFSTVQNPNCVWSYGWTQSRGSTFNLFTQVAEVTQGGLARFWYNPSADALGVGIAVTDYTHPTLFIPGGTLNLHPGPGGQNAVIRWTAPSAGTSTIQGRFIGNDFAGPTTTDVAILRGGAPIFTGSIGSYNVPLNFSVTVQVNAGETIDFTVGFGNGNYFFDSTGISATVSHDSAEPPPLCAGTGCAGANFAAAANFGAGSFPFSVAVGDFNLDGKPDLATPNPNTDTVTILLGNGMGSFTPSAGSPFAAGDFPASVAIGDFNLDSKPDVAIPNVNADTVTILLGNGVGGFTQPTGSPIGAGNGPQSVAVGDFNLDGKPDLATANVNASNVTIMLGNGLGGFTQPAGSPIGGFGGEAPKSVVVGDFNLDGKPDLAAAIPNLDKVSIRLGNGLGGFTQPAGSPVGVGDVPQSLAVGDFNTDGKPDLATANFFSDDVTILLGNGTGGFTPLAGPHLGTDARPRAVAVGDFNLDGKHDLATANINTDNVTILLGNGLGSFTQPAGSPVVAGDEPGSVAVGDFNLDGKPDVATANINSHSVSVLLNTCNTPIPVITSPPSGAVYQIGSTVNFAGSFTDNDGDTHTAEWTFTSNGNSITQAGTVDEINKTVGASYAFTSPGVYLVSILVADNGGSSGTATTVNNDLQAMVVIYDPNGGFVTGGGWIDSPAGAYRPNASLTGRASFGFVSKYQYGAAVPTGNTEFQFRAASFNFASASYEWLVIGGARAQYKGSGTINGNGDYGFMLTAIDGQRTGGGGVDKFRVKIWDRTTGEIVYDNQVGGDTSDSATPNTALGGGSIVIHRP